MLDPQIARTGRVTMDLACMIASAPVFDIPAPNPLGTGRGGAVICGCDGGVGGLKVAMRHLAPGSLTRITAGWPRKWRRIVHEIWRV